MSDISKRCGRSSIHYGRIGRIGDLWLGVPAGMETTGTMTEHNTTDTPSAYQRYSEQALQHNEQRNQREQRTKLARFLKLLLNVLGTVIVLYTLVLAVLFLLGWTAAPLPFADTDDQAVAVAQTDDADPLDIRTWSEEQLAAQMSMVIVDANQAAHFNQWIERGAGALVLEGEKPSSSLGSDLENAQLFATNGVNAFIASNEEGGEKGLLAEIAGVIPTASQLGELEPEEIRGLAVGHGRKLDAVGINLVLGPVVDLGQNGSALTKAGRTFDASGDVVASCAQAYNDGMNEAKVATVLKHWPGLGGYKDVSDAVVAYEPWTELEQRDVRVFQDALHEGTTMVMVGHVVVPDMTEQDTPTSLSRNALGYLRKQVGDNVIILTDNIGTLTRSGFARSSDEAATAALTAGADMVLYRPATDDDTRIIDSIARAIASGTISREEAEAKVERILRIKADRNLSPELKSLKATNR